MLLTIDSHVVHDVVSESESVEGRFNVLCATASVQRLEGSSRKSKDVETPFCCYRQPTTP